MRRNSSSRGATLDSVDDSEQLCGDGGEEDTTNTRSACGPLSKSNTKRGLVVGSAELLDAPRVVRLDHHHRAAHWLTVLPITDFADASATVRTLVDYLVYEEASAWLAHFHLNHPERHILPEIRQRLSACDLRFSLDMRDDYFSILHGAQEVYSIFARPPGSQNNNNSTQNEGLPPLWPVGMVGSARSAVSSSIALLDLAYKMAQVAASSTSGSLDNKVIYPYFARTIPTNAGDAAAAAMFLQSLNVQHVGVLYYSDDYGTFYHDAFVQEAMARNMRVVSVLYSDPADAAAIQQLAQSGLRYFMGIFDIDTWPITVALAAKYQIMGTPGYTWLLAESMSNIIDPSFSLDRSGSSSSSSSNMGDDDVATALNGAGVIVLHVPDNAAFNAELQRFYASSVLKEQFIAQHHDPSVFDGYVFPPTGTTYYQLFAYDAMMALGIAACETPMDIFSGVDLYRQLLQTTFQGVSGYVAFDNATGTRRSESIAYEIVNAILSNNRSTATSILFDAPLSVIVDPTNSQHPVQIQVPFVFSDNTTNTPPQLPPLPDNMNLIPPGARAAGLSLGGLVMMLSMAWFAWAYRYRNKAVVRASQPLFLGQLCIGTFFMSSAVVPLSLQEPVSQRVLDIACMSTPWLISLGFVAAFSALFSKTWRLNKLFQSGHSFRRVRVRPHDVMLPFFVLTALNIIILTLWSVLAPLQWARTPKDDLDQFGRSLSSYGACTGHGNSVVTVFAVLLCVVDFAALIFANYQAYLARNLPTDFNESFYIMISMAVLMEIALLGLPLAFVASSDPTSTFIIRSLLVSISSLVIQLPIFVPKFVDWRFGARREVAVQFSSQSTVATIRRAVTLSNAVVTQSQYERPTRNKVRFDSAGSLDSVSDSMEPLKESGGSDRPKRTVSYQIEPSPSALSTSQGGLPSAKLTSFPPKPPRSIMRSLSVENTRTRPASAPGLLRRAMSSANVADTSVLAGGVRRTMSSGNVVDASQNQSNGSQDPKLKGVVPIMFEPLDRAQSESAAEEHLGASAAGLTSASFADDESTGEAGALPPVENGDSLRGLALSSIVDGMSTNAENDDGVSSPPRSPPDPELAARADDRGHETMSSDTNHHVMLVHRPMNPSATSDLQPSVTTNPSTNHSSAKEHYFL